MLTIYSKRNCPACLSAATMLDNYNIPYTTVKIDEDVAAKEFILSRGFRTVPQIFCGEFVSIEGGWEGLRKMSKEDIYKLIEGMSS